MCYRGKLSRLVCCLLRCHRAVMPSLIPFTSSHHIDAIRIWNAASHQDYPVNERFLIMDFQRQVKPLRDESPSITVNLSGLCWRARCKAAHSDG